VTRLTSTIPAGRLVVVVAAAAMVGTLPGRTQGLGLITEPLLLDLHLDRVTYAELNFWATLIGAIGALGVGRFIDRFGGRVVLITVSLALGAVVCAMSQVVALPTLAIALVLTRAIGQSALSVVSLTIIGQWFVDRIDKAMAIFSIVMSIGFMIAFPVVGGMVQTFGWRTAWLAIGVALIALLAPASFLIPSRAPRAAARGDKNDVSGYTWDDALRTPAFWLFSIGAALYGLVASGIGLFNESILAERGFGPDVYYMTLATTAISALAGNFAGGWLATRIPLERLLATSLAILTLGLAALPHVSVLAHVVAWALAMGVGGGFVMVLFFSVWPRVYGQRHLGRIQGVAQAMTVLASAIGPVLLAWCVTWTGSYGAMFTILAAVIGAVALTALIVSMPPKPASPAVAPA
jgi:MFS family permease